MSCFGWMSHEEFLRLTRFRAAYFVPFHRYTMEVSNVTNVESLLPVLLVGIIMSTLFVPSIRTSTLFSYGIITGPLTGSISDAFGTTITEFPNS